MMPAIIGVSSRDLCEIKVTRNTWRIRLVDVPLRYSQRQQIPDIFDQIDVDRFQHDTLVEGIQGVSDEDVEFQPLLV